MRPHSTSFGLICLYLYSLLFYYILIYFYFLSYFINYITLLNKLMVYYISFVYYIICIYIYILGWCKKAFCIGCDDIALNTGVKTRILTRMESFLVTTERIISLLYTNELPLRHLFRYLDISDPIIKFKLLYKAESMKSITFEEITSHNLRKYFTN